MIATYVGHGCTANAVRSCTRRQLLGLIYESATTPRSRGETLKIPESMLWKAKGTRTRLRSRRKETSWSTTLTMRSEAEKQQSQRCREVQEKNC
ncbi:hypothetical protein N7509_003195 [Penicillium cosmopolitanum]|uniref:Uncharacterized protein n=1 Tax=Penicillium cosmopolitanum TaxID=1131564 RepID=A0A9W9W4H1_9EURO|nr:uncharacterized protein N7509_003195 [Penicillium cosmopolitanum]KAJ5403324.1 hypothetical protein N7509_003195 [Penicillium cosmopolitanum]